MPRYGTRSPLRLLACGLALATSAQARAQGVGGPVEIGDLDLDGLLDPQVAAVSLHEEQASSAPASVFVLTREDLQAHGFRTLAEALRSVPGLFTYSDGFYQYVGFRGVGLLVDYTVRTLVLVDGHPLNNSLGQAENGFGLDLLVPLAVVERIEVVKGPVGSVYGPAAFLGVVNVVTRSGTADSRIEASAGSQAAQGRLVAHDVALAGSARVGGIAITVGAQGTWTPGYTWAFPELASASDRPAPAGGRVAGMDFGDAQKVYVRAGWEGLSLQAGCGHWFRGLPSAPYSTIIGDRRNREETLGCFGQFGLERKVGAGLVLSARLSHDFFDYQDLLGYEAPPGDVGPFRDYGRDSWLTANVQARWQAAPALLATFGVTADRHRTRLEAFAEQIPTLVEDPVDGLGVGPIRKTFFTVNAYALAEWQLLPSLALHGGLTAYRHEVFGSRLTPRAAAIWRSSPSDTLKALYTEGFRAPSASEAFFDDTLDYIPNLALRPETARAGELAWERRIGSTAALFASAFVARYGGLIRVETVPRPGLVGPPDPQNPSDFRQQARNGGSFGVQGVELGGRFRLGRLADGYGGVCLQARIGDAPPNTPAVTANLALASRALWRPLSLAVRGYAIGPRRKDTAALLPGRSPTVGAQLRLDATAALDVPGLAGLTVEAGVLNLLDGRVLHPVANDFAPITQMAEPPITARLLLRYRR